MFERVLSCDPEAAKFPDINEWAIKTKLSLAGVHLKDRWKIYAASTKSLNNVGAEIENGERIFYGESASHSTACALGLSVAFILPKLRREHDPSWI
jgi:hypothetical protein